MDSDNIKILLILVLGGVIIYKKTQSKIVENDNENEKQFPINQHGPFIHDEDYFKNNVDKSHEKYYYIGGIGIPIVGVSIPIGYGLYKTYRKFVEIKQLLKK